MNIRVTGQTQIANAVAHLRAQSTAVAKFENQISSGLRVRTSSDNPTAFANILQAKSASARSAAYQQTISDASTELNASSSALEEVNRILVRSKQLAQEGANSTLDADTYETLANEVDSLLTELVSTANTQQEGRYVFGGTEDGSPPFRVAANGPDGTPSSIAYDGAQERSRTLIGARQTVETKFVGAELFQTAGKDVFQALIDLRDDFRNSALPPTAKATAISNRIGQLDVARTQVGEAIGEQGAAAAGLEAIQSRLEAIQFHSTTRLNELESTDYAEAILRLKEQQTTFEATLAVSSKILQPTLLDFIR